MTGIIKDQFKRLWVLVLDVVFAALSFAAIGCGALFIHKCTEIGKKWGMPPLIQKGMELLGDVLWGVDALLLLWLVIVAAVKCGKDASQE